jgi:hypothetical protein
VGGSQLIAPSAPTECTPFSPIGHGRLWAGQGLFIMLVWVVW